MFFDMTAGDEVKLCPTTIIVQAVQVLLNSMKLLYDKRQNSTFATPTPIPLPQSTGCKIFGDMIYKFPEIAIF